MSDNLGFVKEGEQGRTSDIAGSLSRQGIPQVFFLFVLSKFQKLRKIKHKIFIEEMMIFIELRKIKHKLVI